MPTFSHRNLSRERNRNLRIVGPQEVPEHWRPKTYGDCKDMPRPCPFVGCKYNLYLDSDYNGAIKILGQVGIRVPDVRATDGVKLGLKKRSRFTASAIGASFGADPNPSLDEIMDNNVSQKPQSCALDVANEGGKTLEEIGEIMGLTRERVRQIEAQALERIKDSAVDALEEARACLPTHDEGYNLYARKAFDSTTRKVEDTAEYDSIFRPDVVHPHTREGVNGRFGHTGRDTTTRQLDSVA